MLCLKFSPNWSFTQRGSYGDKDSIPKQRLFTVLLLQMNGWIVEIHLCNKSLTDCWGSWRSHVSSGIKRLQELTKGYSIENMWNIDKSGCFFKALLGTGSSI